ncbi:hypothetical protein J7K25_04240 [bacterium]|nr:hypothetical protein [bacterium]
MRLFKKFITVSMFVKLVSLSFSVPHQIQNLKDLISVEVEENVPKSLPNARWEAIQRAMRRAVEEAAGFQIEGGTAILNSEVKDFISSRTQGYVARWKIIREGEVDDRYEVKMKAWVRKVPLNKDLFFKDLPLKAIYEWVGKPRIAVNVVDLVAYKSGEHAVPQELKFTKRQIEKTFINKGVTIIDVPKNVWNDPKQDKFDIGVEGISTSRLSRKISFLEGENSVDLYIYTNTLQLKIIKFPGREIIASEIYFDPAMGKMLTREELPTYASFTCDEAVKKAIKRNLERRAWDIVSKTIKYWYLELNKPKTISITVENIFRGEEVDTIRRILSILDDVVEERFRGQRDDRAKFEVDFRGTTVRLAEAIERRLPALVRVGLFNDQIYYKKTKGKKLIKPQLYIVSVKDVSLTQINFIKNALADKVSSIEQSSFKNKTVEFNISYFGTNIELAEVLENISGIEIAITGCLGNKITGEIRTKKIKVEIN